MRAHGGFRVIHDQVTPYTRLRVVDRGGWRYLVFDDGSGDPRLTRTEAVYQSKMLLSDPLAVTDSYALAFHIPFAVADVRDCLFIGVGGGTVIRQYTGYHGVSVEAVEIDPVVVDVARKYFGLSMDQRTRVTVADGRTYLADTDNRYDLICVDAFGARTVPRRLCSLDFAVLCRERLRPGGQVAVNVNGAISGDNSRLQEQIAAGYHRVFPSVHLFPTLAAAPRRYQMILLLASAGEQPSIRELCRRSRALASTTGLPVRLEQLCAGRIAPSVNASPLPDGDGDIGLYDN